MANRQMNKVEKECGEKSEDETACRETNSNSSKEEITIIFIKTEDSFICLAF